MFQYIKTLLSNKALKAELDEKIEAPIAAARVEELEPGQYDATLVDSYEPRGKGAGKGITIALDIDGVTRVHYLGIFEPNAVAAGIARRDLAALTGAGTIRDALTKLTPGLAITVTVVKGRDRKFINFRSA
jgi:hypothetical protein